MKKIMFLLPSLVVGGAEKIVREYALYLNKEKFEVIVVTISNLSNTINEKILLDNNIKIISINDLINYKQSDNLIKRFSARLKRYKAFNDIIKREQPDIIHSHSGVNDFLSIIDASNIKLIHSVHSEVSVSFGKGTHFHKWGTKYCIKNHDMKILVLHKRMEHEVREMFNTTNTSILNVPINIEYYSNYQTPSTILKQKLNIPKETFVIGHVGSFRKVKNHEFLIRIFNEVIKYNKDSILLLIGEGDLEQEIKNKVHKLGLENKVYFLGLRDDIPDLMNIMDVLVFPSFYEGFPLTLLETQASGTAAIVSDTVTEEVNVTNLIRYIDLNKSPETWAEAILKPISRKINVYGLSNYDINNVIKKLENIYWE